MVVELLKQQTHQRAMVEDPADGALIPVDRIQIAAAEANAARACVIPQFQCFETSEGGFEW